VRYCRGLRRLAHDNKAGIPALVLIRQSRGRGARIPGGEERYLSIGQVLRGYVAFCGIDALTQLFTTGPLAPTQPQPRLHLA
jgi:hypothetical protein